MLVRNIGPCLTVEVNVNSWFLSFEAYSDVDCLLHYYPEAPDAADGYGKNIVMLLSTSI